MRNDKGEAIAGSSHILLNLSDATMAETYALKLGLELVDRVGCHPINIETDCLELVQAFNGEIVIGGPYNAVLAYCFQLASRIGDMSMHHCFREANKVAHNLARSCFDSDTPVFWDCDPLALLSPM